MAVTTPFFMPGSTNRIYVDALQIDVSACVTVALEAEAMDGQETSCSYSNCTTPDTAPPTFTISSYEPGPPAMVQIGVQDIDSGLVVLESSDIENATVDIPGFTSGTSAVVSVAAEQGSGVGDSSFSLYAQDSAGNASSFVYNFPLSQTDTQPPEWHVDSIDPGPPISVWIHIQDLHSGLKSIIMTETENATIDIPSFPQGITSPPVEISATQVAPSENMTIAFTLEDMAGNTATGNYELLADDSDPPECALDAFQAGPPAFFADQGSGFIKWS